MRIQSNLAAKLQRESRLTRKSFNAVVNLRITQGYKFRILAEVLNQEFPNVFGKLFYEGHPRFSDPLVESGRSLVPSQRRKATASRKSRTKKSGQGR